MHSDALRHLLHDQQVLLERSESREKTAFMQSVCIRGVFHAESHTDFLGDK